MYKIKGESSEERCHNHIGFVGENEMQRWCKRIEVLTVIQERPENERRWF